MFTLLNTILLLIILFQVLRLRRDFQEIDCPAAKEIKKLRNPIRQIKKY